MVAFCVERSCIIALDREVWELESFCILSGLRSGCLEWVIWLQCRSGTGYRHNVNNLYTGKLSCPSRCVEFLLLAFVHALWISFFLVSIYHQHRWFAIYISLDHLTSCIELQLLHMPSHWAVDMEYTKLSADDRATNVLHFKWVCNQMSFFFTC